MYCILGTLVLTANSIALIIIDKVPCIPTLSNRYYKVDYKIIVVHSSSLMVIVIRNLLIYSYRINTHLLREVTQNITY